ncbi:DoxX family membrane protein [Sphingobacterium faecium]|uniref:DoxX family membrane protein n=1 Tax=Sphingobacterium faecium TaxID=34087 RepID=UPI0024698694|nr:DoxX family membrane protein [Sphingobacterium faecium]MDH5825882.1 DoxX family membrane protein [Sphingobacterium faecium]
MSLQRGIKAIFSLLRITLGIVPIVAGLDKFTNILTNWEQYLNPVLVQILPFSAHTFMMVVGIIEIIAGILVLRRPVIGGYVVAVWLTAIALSLLASFSFVDVAVRDLVMAISAFSLAKMAKLIEN